MKDLREAENEILYEKTMERLRKCNGTTLSEGHAIVLLADEIEAYRKKIMDLEEHVHALAIKRNEKMQFREAWFQMLNGKKIKRTHWAGYWEWENNTIMIHTREGAILDIRETDNPAYTFTNVAAKDWEVVDE